MSKLAKTTVLYVQDFEKTVFGNYEINGISSPYKADFYDIPPGVKEHLEHINQKLHQISNSEEKDVAKFMLEMDKIKNELTTFVFKEFPSIADLKITSHHGHGLEAGIQAQLKPQFSNKVSLKR